MERQEGQIGRLQHRVRKTSGLNFTEDGVGVGDGEEEEDRDKITDCICSIRRGVRDEEHARQSVVFGFIGAALGS